MRLTVYTDYTLRVLMYLTLKYKTGERSTISDIAQSYGISRNHLMKIVHQLGQQGVVQTVRGRSGGMVLARPPQDITVGEIVRFTETDYALVECHQEDTAIQCIVAGHCNLTAAFRTALRDFFRALDQITLDQVVGPQTTAALQGLATRNFKRIPIEPHRTAPPVAPVRKARPGPRVKPLPSKARGSKPRPAG